MKKGKSAALISTHAGFQSPPSENNESWCEEKNKETRRDGKHLEFIDGSNCSLSAEQLPQVSAKHVAANKISQRRRRDAF